MTSRFKIGLTALTLTSLDELAVPLPDPQPEFRKYQRKDRLGNAKMKGRGPQKIFWEFPILEIEQQNEIDDFNIADPIYIQSPDKEDVDTVYQVDVNVLDPRESGSHKVSFPGHRTGFAFEFIVLSEVV
jgi:hypothetical protein